MTPNNTLRYRIEIQAHNSIVRYTCWPSGMTTIVGPYVGRALLQTKKGNAVPGVFLVINVGSQSNYLTIYFSLFINHLRCHKYNQDSNCDVSALSFIQNVH